jgi:hypothetical protein
MTLALRSDRPDMGEPDDDEDDDFDDEEDDRDPDEDEEEEEEDEGWRVAGPARAPGPAGGFSARSA